MDHRPHYSSSYLPEQCFCASHQMHCLSSFFLPKPQNSLSAGNFTFHRATTISVHFVLDLSSKVVRDNTYWCLKKDEQKCKEVAAEGHLPRTVLVLTVRTAAGIMCVLISVVRNLNAWVIQMDQRWALHTVPEFTSSQQLKSISPNSTITKFKYLYIQLL